MSREIAFSQIPHISPAAESGGVAASYFDRRQHQAPASWPSPILRFLAPSPARPSPRPSAASRPMPRSPRSAA